MRKKTKEEDLNYAFELFSFWWEFLRRNKEYMQDYIKYALAYEDFDETNEDNADAFNKYVVQQAAYFMNKYGITRPASPSFSLSASSNSIPPKLMHEFLQDRLFKSSLVNYSLDSLPCKVVPDLLRGLHMGAYCITPDRHDHLMNIPDTQSYEDLTNEEIRKQDKIVVLIDLDAPLKTIINEVQQIVVKWKKARNKVLPSRRRRKRFLEYERYLKVFDLRNKRWSWKRLAEKFYKSDMERDPDYAKRKVKRDYERCKELVDGGYRQIR